MSALFDSNIPTQIPDNYCLFILAQSASYYNNILDIFSFLFFFDMPSNPCTACVLGDFCFRIGSLTVE
jgi:hypothetical protein